MTVDQNENADYLARREAQERALAKAAVDPAARRVHQDLAQHYAERRAALTPPVSDAA